MMIDCETLSIKSDAALLSVGIVIFDGESILKEEELNINIINALYYGETDKDTLKWWMDNKKAFTTYKNKEHIPLFEVCNKLCGLIEYYKVEKFWAKGFMDFLWIQNAFDKFNLEYPWKYYMLRDLRVVFDLFNVKHKTTKHTALDDAKEQTLLLINTRKQKESITFNILNKTSNNG